MDIYTDKGCKCKDSDPIYADMEYIVVDDESIKNIKEIHSQELNQLKTFGKMILGQNVSDTLINNWAKVKHYYQYHTSELNTESIKIGKARSILNSFSSSSKVGDDLKCGKDLLTFSHSLHKLGAKTLLFDAGCADSLRILITSNSHSIFNDSGVQGNTKIKFIALLQNVFHEMGDTYTPVNITSGFRTSDDQARIMAGMLQGNGMINLYKGVSVPYLGLIQELYNTGNLSIDEPYIKQKEFEYWSIALTHNQYNAIGDKNNENVYIIYKGNSSLCQLLLQKIFDEGICRPSYHQVGQAFDLSPKTDTVLKASSLYPESKQMKRETYIHFTII